MNAERKITLIYFVLGLGTGILSKYISVILSIGVGVALYLISFLIVKNLVKDDKKKFSWYIMNTLVTFVLVWLITWIFLFNL